jgi:hypothetical protein
MAMTNDQITRRTVLPDELPVSDREGVHMSTDGNPDISLTWTPGFRPVPRPDDRPEVVELAQLLPRVAALTSDLTSDDYSHHDRKRLRELVQPGTYFVLLVNLADLRSEFAQRSRRAARRLNRLTVDLRTFFADYRASNGAEPAHDNQS